MKHKFYKNKFIKEFSPISPRKSKYGNERCIIDGITFLSKKEGNRFKELQILQESGEVLCFILQAAFYLNKGAIKIIEGNEDKPKIIPPREYVSDFVVFWKDGTVTIEDVKGKKTDLYKLKKAQIESIFPFEITEI